MAITFRAFNRWLAEDWGLNWQNRIFGAPYISLADVDFAVDAGMIVHPERVTAAADLAAALRGDGLRIIEVRADRTAGAQLRARIGAASAARVAVLADPAPS